MYSDSSPPVLLKSCFNDLSLAWRHSQKCLSWRSPPFTASSARWSSTRSWWWVNGLKCFSSICLQEFSGISLPPQIISHQASLDQPTQTVVMHRTEPTSLQNMALQLAEKLGSLVENNERVFDVKQGVYGGYFNRGALRQHTDSQAVCINSLHKLTLCFSVTDQKGGYQQKQSYQRGTFFLFFPNTCCSPKTASLLSCSSKLGLLKSVTNW